ncbi:peptidase C14, caspase domain-containing protein [Mycena amicta]|nr:peptidase C14, caspase domain-containing protein [Mycena amicta]
MTSSPPTSPLCERCSAASPISTRSSTSTQPWREPKRKALLIGINSLSSSDEGHPTLHGPQRDAKDMKKLLVDSYDFLEEDIQLLVDDGHSDHLQPDRANIMLAIKRLVNDTRAGDKLFFLYCGHTIQVPSRSPTEEDGLDECIVPLDGEDHMIKDNELRSHLVDPLPAGSSLVAVFDSCHSASLLDLEHQRCNRVFVPWLSKGKRRTDELRNRMVRHLALPAISPSSYSLTRSSPTQARSRRISIDVAGALSPISPRYNPLSPLILSPVRRYAPCSPKSPNGDMRHASFAENRINIPGSSEPIQRRAHLPAPLQLWEMNKENLLSVPHREQSASSPLTASPWYTGGDTLSDGFPSPATTTILSPSEALYDSPVQTFCQGWCRGTGQPPLECSGKPSPSQAFVISLAACKDSELSWETEDGTSMTQALIQVLRADAHPTLRELVTRISHTLHGLARERHSRAHAWKTYRRTHAIMSAGLGSFDTETFQHPQVASHKPLDMELRWEL